MNRAVAPVALDRLEQGRGRASLQRQRGCAGAQRKDQLRAQPEGEGDRRRGGNDIIARETKQLAGIAVGGDENVAVELDAALRRAGSARGEGDDCRIVTASLDRRQRRERFDLPFDVAASAVAIEGQDAQRPAALSRRHFDLAAKPCVDDRMVDLGLGEDRCDFTGAQQRHQRYRDPARLEDAEPSGE